MGLSPFLAPASRNNSWQSCTPHDSTSSKVTPLLQHYWTWMVMLFTLWVGIYLHAPCWLPSLLNCHHLLALGFSLFPTLDKFKAAIHSCSQDLELQNTMGSFSSVQEDTDKYSDGFQWVKRGFVVLFTFRAGICTVAVPAPTMVTDRPFLGFLMRWEG